jgi:outer membrane receptor protein involved in Fe transport
MSLKGRIIDSGTNQPLKGAEVYLIKTKCGGVSNLDGNFLLLCSQITENDTLMVAYLGYENYQCPVSDFISGSIIKLSPKTLTLNEIIVSGERMDILRQDIPHAINSLELQEIEQYGSSDISDVLKPIPSVRIEGNDLDGRRIQIRGSNPDEVKVYYDGILLNDMRLDNSADLSIIPLESIERLEILKGGNLTFLGNGAFGGIVNITSRQITEQTIHIKGKIGSFESRYLIGQINLPLTKKLIVNYFGQINGWSPVIEFFPGERFSRKTRNDQIKTAKQNHNISLNYFTQNGQLSTKFIGYFFNYEKPFWISDYNNFLTALSYKGKLFGSDDFDINVSHLFSRNQISRIPAGTANYLSNFESNRVNARIAKKFPFKATEIQLLAEYFHDDLIADSKIRDIDQETTYYHAFLYDNRFSVAGVVSFDDYLKKLPIVSWKTYLGSRADFLATGESDVNHMIGAQLNYRRERWTLSPYINYGQNAKYPTLQDNAYIADIMDFTRSDSTAERLKPERSTSAEIGINYSYYTQNAIYRRLDLSLSLFTTTMFNKILTQPFDDFIANVQIGRNVTRGIEASLKFNEIFRHFHINIAYVQLDITNPLLYAYKPDKNFSAHLQYSSKLGLYLTTTFFYEGKSLAWFYDTENNIQTENISPFYDMDISIGIRIPVQTADVDLQFSGHNIFDNSGFKYYYLKKRYLQFSLSVRY